MAKSLGRVRVLLEVTWFDPVKGYGRLIVREPGLHGSVTFFIKELPDSVRGPSTEVYRQYRRTKKPTELRNALRRKVKEALAHVRFRADVAPDSDGIPRLVEGTIEPASAMVA